MKSKWWDYQTASFLPLDRDFRRIELGGGWRRCALVA
jgi:hypothetical protein